MSTVKQFSLRLIQWYERHKRDLPWRDTKDPYKIWLSEIILQQTRVNQGLPYYLKFVEKYPTIHLLSQATQDEVLRLWQGLGYYTRARKIHECSQEIVKNHNGIFPSSFKKLKCLPGIGHYTASAIASFSFKEKVPVIDANVKRVITRIFGIQNDISKTKTIDQIYEISNQIIKHSKPNVYNQAIMEFGALQCLPKTPDCPNCIFKKECFANCYQLQQKIPVNRKKIDKRNRYFHYIVFVYNNQTALCQRKEKDIWKELYNFYLIETPTRSSLDKVFINVPFKDSIKRVSFQSQTYKHVLTHRNIFAKFYVLPLYKHEIRKANHLNINFYTLEEVQRLPKPILIENFLKKKKMLFLPEKRYV